MAIMDKKLELSDAQNIHTGVTITGFSVGSANVINLGTGYNCWNDTKYNDIGIQGMWLNVAVATTISPPSAELSIYLQTASTAAAATASTGATVLGKWKVTATGTSTTTGNFVAGKSLVRARLPAGTDIAPYAQYLGLLYHESQQTLASILTAGAVNAWISMDSESEAPRS
jgi:hypothetical protein